jgi:hypothetical protein
MTLSIESVIMGQVCDNTVCLGFFSVSICDVKPVYTYPVDIPAAYPAKRIISTVTLELIFPVLDSGLSLKPNIMI